jgi:hypothetical protein
MKKILLILSVVLLSLPIFAQSIDTDKLYRRAEIMPLFKTCDIERLQESDYQCSLKQLTDKVYNSIQVENPSGKMTKALVSLIVEKDGSISNVSIEREAVFGNLNDSSLAAYVNSALLNVFNDLSFKSSGIHEGENVRVKLQFTQPIGY